MRNATLTRILGLVAVSSALLAAPACEGDKSHVVLEIGERGPQYLPGETITLQQGTALYVRFQREWSRDRVKSILYKEGRRSPVEVTSGTDHVNLLPDVEREFWLLIGTTPGRAEITVLDEEPFLVNVVAQPANPPRPVLDADAGPDAGDSGL